METSEMEPFVIAETLVIVLFGVLEVVLTLYMFGSRGWAALFPWIGYSFLILFAFIMTDATMEAMAEKHKLAAMNPDEREKYLETKAQEEAEKQKSYKAQNKIRQYGTKNIALLCPHCQTKGFVRMTQAVRVTKNRVNSVAGKAIGLGTNSESQVTQLHCDNCDMTWDA